MEAILQVGINGSNSPSATSDGVSCISGTVVDVEGRRLFGARIVVGATGRIEAVVPEASPGPGFILPGFVDAHIHIESALITPAAFARAAVRHGTVAAVTDPHEIANVLGAAGVDFMLAEGARTPFVMATGAPSCVPATPFETAGATLDAAAVAALLDRPGVTHLAEVMNVPGVLGGDPDLLAKLAAARARSKPIDGHAPGLRGAALRAYIAAGITTDHECLDLEEAYEKAAAGMTILLRCGSAARTFEALLPVLARHPGACMLCSDDKHPDDLLEGHINDLVRIAVGAGLNVFDVLRAACVNPVRHYGLDVGQLRPGDRADWVEVEDLRDFRVRRTVIGGRVLAADGRSAIPERTPLRRPNQFALRPVSAAVFRMPARAGTCRVIGVRDGELVTDALSCIPTVRDGVVVADPARGLAKLAVFNRYAAAVPPALALVSGLGLGRGAVAASVAHDSHPVIAAGVDDDALAAAVNAVVAHGGGLAVADGTGVRVMPLPIAGLMSAGTCEEAAAATARIDAAVRACGCALRAPFMTLSFLALPVIPALKLTDLGLFDAVQFKPVGFWI
jgi:adenine deaminase